MKNRSYSSGIQISSKSCEMAFSIKQLHRIKLLWFNVPTGSVHKKEPTSYIFSQRMKKKPLLMAENFSAIKPRRAEFPYSVFGIFSDQAMVDVANGLSCVEKEEPLFAHFSRTFFLTCQQ